MHQYSRPWSLLRTPVQLNPRAGGDPRLLPITTGIEEFREIMEKPQPWHYLERGFVLWEGPSPIDGQEIVAIVTGLDGRPGEESENVKTGPMLQTWILLKNIPPQEAIDTGRDSAICGACCHRGEKLERPRMITRARITPAEARRGVGIAGGPQARRKKFEVQTGGRTCYVVAAQAPTTIWKAYHRGIYPKAPESELPLIGYGRLARLGSYGDPAMVPAKIWRSLIWDSLGWTGYTHQWREPWARDHRTFIMASVDTEEEIHEARYMRWRTFRVLLGDQQLVAGTEIVCPASHEGGFRKTCDACRACQGAMPGKAPWRERERLPASVAIKIHPRWQILYWPRSKKGKRLRGHRPDMEGKRTKQDPPRRPTEILLFDYMPGAEQKKIIKVLRKAEKQEDPAAYLEEVRGQFSDYYQFGFDRAQEVLVPGKRKRASGRKRSKRNPVHPYYTYRRVLPPDAPTVRRPPVVPNPRAVHELRNLIRLKREELDDARYFRRGDPAGIEAEIAALEAELAEAEGAVADYARRGMRATRHEIERDRWRRGYMQNPTQAEAILERAVRPCMTREEAHAAAKSIERSLEVVARGAMVSGKVRDRILNALWKARQAKTPTARIKSLTLANRLLAETKTKAPARRRRRRRDPGKDPRLGHLMRGPQLSEAALARRREFEREELAANPWSSNPLLAIVGNPGPHGQGLEHHRRQAMRLIHQAVEAHDFGALHQAHEHLNSAYLCCSNPPNPAELGVLDEVLEQIGEAEEVIVSELYEGGPSKAVAGSGKRGRVKGRKKGARRNRPRRAGKPGKPVKRYSIEEAREKFEGFDEAYKAYTRFHDNEPGHVDLYELDDGLTEERVEPVHAALHRRLETNYIVPWASNKKGSLWKHEHIEGALKGDVDLEARAEDLPLDVFNPFTKQMITMPNHRWHVTDWHRERGAKHRRH